MIVNRLPTLLQDLLDCGMPDTATGPLSSSDYTTVITARFHLQYHVIDLHCPVTQELTVIRQALLTKHLGPIICPGEMRTVQKNSLDVLDKPCGHFGGVHSGQSNAKVTKRWNVIEV